MSGQQDNRDERMQETKDWLNAIPMDSENHPLLESQDGVDPGFVAHEVEAIRTALEVGADNVSCFVSNPATHAAIVAELSEEELRRVEFPALHLSLP